MFNILDLDSEDLISDPDGKVLEFLSGMEANEYCKKFPQNRYQPRRQGNDLKWQERERERVKTGVYICIPGWLEEYEMNDHHLHISKDKSPLLSYTKNDLNGRFDIQTRISIEGYMEKYHSLCCGEKVIRKVITRYKDEMAPLPEVKFAETPEEIVAVYKNFSPQHQSVAGSCMRHEFRNLPIHPTALYGAGDLAVAYFVDDVGRTTARAICWPEKKIYSRMYADNDRLHRALKEKGFIKSGYYGEGGPYMEGARLLVKPFRKGIYVMPYIDEPIGVRLMDEYFILTQNSEEKYHTRTQHGVSVENYDPSVELITCAHCENGYSRNSMMRVIHHIGEPPDFWCESCVDEDAYLCNYSGDYYARAEIRPIEMGDGGFWNEFDFKEHGFLCQKTGLRYSIYDKKLIHFKDGHIEQWHNDACLRYAKYDGGSNTWIAKE